MLKLNSIAMYKNINDPVLENN